MKVLIAGNCNFDNSLIRRTFHSFPNVELKFCDSAVEVLDALGETEFKLVLINRVFDRTDEKGIELIQKIKTEISQPPSLMLISNFEEAQAAAVASGALPGFGKSALGSDAVRQQLADVLSGQSAEA